MRRLSTTCSANGITPPIMAMLKLFDCPCQSPITTNTDPNSRNVYVHVYDVHIPGGVVPRLTFHDRYLVRSFCLETFQEFCSQIFLSEHRDHHLAEHEAPELG